MARGSACNAPNEPSAKDRPLDIIDIRGLTKRYGRRVGIESLDLRVPAGTLFGFLGPNGSGKSTVIRVLMGLLRPTAGSARVFDLDAWRCSHQIKSEVGYLPGDLRLYPFWTCDGALRLISKVRRRDVCESGRKLAEEFELDTDVPVRSMSRGMRQKLGLILALAHRPKLLILDEPTSALDPIMQKRLLRRLRDLASNGHTVFFSSHTLSEVEALCHRVAILRSGRLVANESLSTLRQQAKRLVTIRWRSNEPAGGITLPDHLDVLSKRDGEWLAEMSGASAGLLRWAATQPIEDLSIGEPDLARLFEKYYE